MLRPLPKERWWSQNECRFEKAQLERESPSVRIILMATGSPGGKGKNAASANREPPVWPFVGLQLIFGAAGIALIVAAIAFWATDEKGSISTMTEKVTTTKPAPIQRNRSNRRRTNTRRTTTTKVTTKTTLTGNPKKRSEASSPQSVSERSETLTIAMLGLGLLALLCGALLSSITEITLPGGLGAKFKQRELREGTAEATEALKEAIAKERTRIDTITAEAATRSAVEGERARQLEARLEHLERQH
jgi:hypothetical protein